MKVNVAPVLGSTQRAAGSRAVGGIVRAERDFASIGVDRVREQVIDRDAGLEVDSGPKGETFHQVVAERVAHKPIRGVAHILVQDAGNKLLPQEVEVATREIEE